MKAQKLVTLIFMTGFFVSVISCSTKKVVDNEDIKSKVVTSIRSFNTVQIEPAEVKGSTNITGRVIPFQKVEVVSQVQGIARGTAKPFKEGVDFKSGQVLVNIDSEEFRNNLTAQKSQFLSSLVRIMSDLKIDYPEEFETWNRYLESISIEKSIPQIPDVDRAQLRYFLSANNIYNLYYSIKSAEETLQKYQVRAPFDGTVVESTIDRGSLVRLNTKLGEFIRTDKYEIQASVSISAIQSIKEGLIIPFTSPDMNGKWDATVHRIGKRVDPATQAVTVYLTVSGEDLKEGMYLEGTLDANIYEDAVELSKELITRNNQVYLIKDSTVQLKNVELLAFNSGTVIVSGLDAGDRVIVDPIQSPVQGIVAVAK